MTKPIGVKVLVWDPVRKVRRQAAMYWTDEIKNLVQEPTATQWKEGYVEQQRALADLHEALLTIWRGSDPEGRKYLTYQDPDEVVREALDRIRTAKADAWDEGAYAAGKAYNEEPNPYREGS